MKIKAEDQGKPSKFSFMNLTVVVTDVIDTKPFFSPSLMELTIYENATVRDTVLSVSAKDNDLDDFLSYKITSNSNQHVFTINSTSGDIYLMAPLDRENISFYIITVQAIDSAGFISDPNGLTISIHVGDINDNPPKFTTSDCSSEISEETPNGLIISTISASDEDIGDNAIITYSLSKNIREILKIDPEKGLIMKNGDLTQYAGLSLNYAIYAADNGDIKLTSMLNCTLHVIDVNNNSPKFNQSSYVVYVSENVSTGYIVANFTATEQDGGVNALINYYLVGSQGLFEVNKTTVSFLFLCKPVCNLMPRTHFLYFFPEPCYA